MSAMYCYTQCYDRLFKQLNLFKAYVSINVFIVWEKLWTVAFNPINVDLSFKLKWAGIKKRLRHCLYPWVYTHTAISWE